VAGGQTLLGAAALYTEDMYVDAGLSADTAAAVRGLRAWTTNASEPPSSSAKRVVVMRAPTKARWPRPFRRTK
jgi:hypothetical protein